MSADRRITFFIQLMLCLVLPGPIARAEDLSLLLTQGEKAVKDDQFGELSQIIPNLKAERVKGGYQNLSLFSELLLAKASSVCGRDSTSCKFLTETALDLSPSDPVISFGAAKLAKSYSYLDSFSLHWRTFKNINNSPTLLIKGISLLGIAILTLCSLVLCCHILSNLFRLKSVPFLSERYGPILLAALLMLGLPFGLIPALVTWSITVAIAAKKVRPFIYIAAVTFGWLCLLPISENLIRHGNNPLERANELLLSRIASPSSIAGQNPGDAISQLAAATLTYQIGDLELALQHFKLISQTEGESRLGKIALARLGATELALRDFSSAKRSFERATNEKPSFEMVQNLALASLGMAEIEAQRGYLERLKSMDRKRFEGESIDLAVMMEPIPTSEFLARYLAPPEKVVGMTAPTVTWLKNQEVIKPLMTMGGVSSMVALIVLSILLAFVPYRRFA